MKNRSVPVDTVLPHIFYDDVAGAIAWLSVTFGFKEHFRYGEPGGDVQGAQLFRGSAWIMLGGAREDRGNPMRGGYSTQFVTVFVDDVDAHFGMATGAGAKIVEDLHETVYGERQYAAEDLEGHRWIFSQHARDRSPEEWGATLAK